MGTSNLSERFKKEVHLFVQDGELSDSEKRVLFEIAEEDGIDEKIAERYMMEQYKIARHNRREEEERKRKPDWFDKMAKGGSLLTTMLAVAKFMAKIKK